MENWPLAPASPWAATAPPGASRRMCAAPGRGAHVDWGGVCATGQTGLKRTVPRTNESEGPGTEVDVAVGTVTVGALVGVTGATVAGGVVVAVTTGTTVVP